MWAVKAGLPGFRYQFIGKIVLLPMAIHGNRTLRFIDANQNGQLDAGDTDITQYTWDHRNRLVKVEHRASYAAAVDRVIENAYDYANRCAGQLTALARYADLAGTQLVAQSDYTYDQAGRLRNLTHFRGQTTFVEHTWNFDAANRMTQYINSIDGTADYTSDAAGQLTAADYDYQSDENYQYDQNGNRITANGSTYTTDDNNQLLSDGTYRYQYDAEGTCGVS